MSASKYFVWSGSRWRELDIERGSVAGWDRRPRFVFVRRGKLRVAARRRVLSALQALAARSPSAAGLGPRLSVRSRASSPPLTKLKSIAAAPTACEHHHCCMYSNKQTKACSHSLTNGDSAPSTRRDAGVQHRTTADAAVQSTLDQYSLNINKTNQSPVKRNTEVPKAQAPRLGTRNKKQLQENHRPEKRKRNSLSDDDIFKTQQNDKNESKSKKFVSEQAKSKKSRSKREEEKSNDQEAELCKELTISDSDVNILRNFVARTKGYALERFDTDESYKRALFYSINPLVDVERCAKTERALRERHDIVLPHFAARLGLTPQGSIDASPSRRQRTRRPEVKYRERSSSSTDKGNKYRKKDKSEGRSKKSTKITGKSSSDDSDSEESEEFKNFNKKPIRKSIERNAKAKRIQSKPQRNTNTTYIEDSDSETEDANFQKSNKKIKTSNSKPSTQTDTNSDSSNESECKENRKKSLRTSTKAQSSIKQPQITIDSTTDNSKSDTDSSSTIVSKILKKLAVYRSENIAKAKIKSGQNKNPDSDDENLDTKRQSLRKAAVKQNKEEQTDDSTSSDDDSETSKTRKSRKNIHKANKQNTDDSDSSDDFKKDRKKYKESSRSPKRTKEKKMDKQTDNKQDSVRKSTVSQSLGENRGTNRKVTENNRKTAKYKMSDFDSDEENDKNKRNKKTTQKYPKEIQHTDSENDDESGNKTAKRNKSINSNEKNDKNKNSVKFIKKKDNENYIESDSEFESTNKTNRKFNNKAKQTSDSDTDSSSDDKKSNKTANKKTKQNNKDSDFENDSKNKHNKRKNAKSHINKNIRKNIAKDQSESENSSAFKKKTNSTGIPVKTQSNQSRSTDGNKKSTTGSKSGSEKRYVFKPTSSSTIPRLNKSKENSERSGSMDSHTISKRASNHHVKEYSNLEDHAIVAWVSSGARASRVNGNALWRELQLNYFKLTGTSRSWHSLRNRYLRYILPSLGALRLPPADVSRLRAAAATGSIKNKRRRNSIFKEEPVVSASSRRPRLEIQREDSIRGKEDRNGDSDGKEEAGSSTKRQSLRSYFVAPRPYNDIRQSSSAVNSPATPNNKRKRDDSGKEQDESANKGDESRKVSDDLGKRRDNSRKERDTTGNKRDVSGQRRSETSKSNKRDTSQSERDESENRRNSLRNRGDSKKDVDSKKEGGSNKTDDAKKRDSLRNGSDNSKNKRNDRRKDDATDSDGEVAPPRTRRSLTQSSQPVPSTSNTKSRKLFNPKLIL